MTDQEKIAELEAKIAQMQQEQQPKPKMNIKMGNKQNVVVGGAALKQRFPVTLYAPSWIALLEYKDDIHQFIEDHRDELSWERE